MNNHSNIISRSGLAVLAVGALCFTGSAFAAEKAADMQVDQKDKDFMMEAGKGGMMEVDAGKMAEEKGKSADVKKIGKMMVTDHTKANNELMALAKKKGVMLDTTHKMEKMDESNFDQAYLDSMVKDHEKDIAAFEKEAKDGKDAETKSWASKTLPTLKKHLKMVQDAQAKMKKG